MKRGQRYWLSAIVVFSMGSGWSAVAQTVNTPEETRRRQSALESFENSDLGRWLRELQEESVLQAGILPQEDCATNGCDGVGVGDVGHASRAECGWCERLSAAGGDCSAASFTPGDCAALADPVDARMCRLNLWLDGDVTDAHALGATQLIDQVFDNSGHDPGFQGDQEEPRAVIDDISQPNGINITRTLLLFFPDDNPSPAIDTSFLYLAWDISDDEQGNTQNAVPVPFDSDDNGSACHVEDGSTPGSEPLAGIVSDMLSEGYQVIFQLCTPLDQYNVSARSPNNIGVDNDLMVYPNILPPTVPLFLAVSPAGISPDVEMFPTADLSPAPVPGPINPTNGCIDRERVLCANGNNLEIVIKRVESKAAFGPNPLTRRFGLAQLLARTRADSAGDTGDEEFASVALRTALPDIEASKRVRCVNSGTTGFTSAVDILPDSEVEYQVSIRNTGNTDLLVTVTDQMGATGSQSGLVNCTPQCGTLAAKLHRGVDVIDITPANATTYGLQPEFFVDTCVAPEQGFLGAAAAGAPIVLGTLKGATVTRVNSACGLTLGDELVLTYRATPGATDLDAFCDARDDVDCSNSISVSGAYGPVEPITLGMQCVESFINECDDGLYCNGVEMCSNGACEAGEPPCGAMGNCDEVTDSCGLPIVDIADVADSFEEGATGVDDNVADVNVLCREFEFTKSVGFPGEPASFVTGDDALRIFTIPAGDSREVEYVYAGTNGSELTEDVTITDQFLCADAVAAGATFAGCPICTNGVPGEITLTVAPGQPYSTSCILRFDSQSELRDFIESDAGHPACTDPDFDRYRNCATASILPEPGGIGDVCDGALPIDIDSYATIENGVCVLDVQKEVRCLPDCTPPADPEAGWVTDPAQLDVTAGACVQYRVTIGNISTAGVPVCALRIIDEMINSSGFAAGPDNVQVQSPAACANLPGDFNWDGVPVECNLASPLQPGEQMVLTFEGRLNSAGAIDSAADPLNRIRIEGVPNEECSAPPLFFSCTDVSSVGLDVRECDFELTKDVTCDDPRAPGAVFEPDLVDALPGSTIGFRIQLTNTGEVNLAALNLTDSLGCLNWFIPGSVVADVENSGGTVTDVLACVCPGGVCSAAADLDGDHDLTACSPEGVPTNGVLTITFKVEVPADFAAPGTLLDCTNTATAQPTPTACHNSLDNPCDLLTDSASINVDVPDIACAETICADLDADGTCDTDDTSTLQLNCEANAEYPIVLQYTFTLDNTGEAPFASTEICKPGFVAAAVAAGIEVNSCGLCNGACDGIDDECGEAGAIATNGTLITGCELTIPDRAAWLAFAAADGGDENCHTNSITVTGNVDTTGLCADGGETTATSACGAEACIAPDCNLEVEKTFRCLDNCADASPLGVGTNALEVLPGATVEFTIVARNAGTAGDPAICNLEFTDALSGPFVPCTEACTVQVIDGLTNPLCAVPVGFVRTDGTPFALDLVGMCGGAALPPGGEVHITCAGTVPDDASGTITNSIDVRGAPTCPLGGPNYCCSADADALVDIDTCGLTVDKLVTCDDPADPNADFDPDVVNALPGSTVAFAFDVCNTGDAALTAVRLADTLTCADWYAPGSAVAFVGGVDVTSCVCPPGGCDDVGDLTGEKDLTACAAGGIPTNGCLTIAFEVAVPDDFAALGTPLDCRNTIEVTGFSDICANPDADSCGFDIDTAGINVLVPDVECAKTVCADINNDGDCADAVDLPATTDLQMTCAVNDEFPIRLIYNFALDNTGETGLINGEACDPDLVADALAAGATIGACDLCTGACDGVNDTCAQVGPLLRPGAQGPKPGVPQNHDGKPSEIFQAKFVTPAAQAGVTVATCEIIFPTVESWLNFAAADGADEDCHTNSITALADVDTVGLCSRDADTQVTSDCSAQVCIAPPCVLEVDKTVRCVDNCAGGNPGPDVDLLEALPGATVEFVVTARNAGGVDDPAICNLEFTDTVIGNIVACPGECTVQVNNGAANPVCAVPAGLIRTDGVPFALDLAALCGVELAPGDELQISCLGIIPADATGTITNTVAVRGATLCAAPTIEYCCEDTDDAAVDIDTCSLSVAKYVTCDDPADAGATLDPDVVVALPGATVGFVFDVCNTGDVSFPSVDLTDNLSCPWFTPLSVSAFIGGTDVTDCVCPPGGCTSIADLNGEKNLDACVAGGIPTNGCLTVAFEVAVPADFASAGTPLDCENTISVQGLPELCGAGDGTSACPPAIDTAGINVVVPDVECAETICVDADGDTVCDAAPTDDLNLGCSANDEFPLSLHYTFTVGNPGEPDLADSEVCKPGFVAAAVAAGITVGPCDLCTGACDGTGDDCGSAGAIAAGGSGTASCWLQIPNRAAWDAFAASDDADPDCHTNALAVTGFVDTTGLCDTGADTTRESTCGASACIAPDCTLEVEKSVHCLDNCTDLNIVDADTSALAALAGATVEFQIVARNAGVAGDEAICSLRFTDVLGGPFEPCPDACTVQLINGAGDPVCSAAPALTTNGFNLTLDLLASCGALLAPGDEVVILCAGTIPADAVDDVTSNSVFVEAAAQCPAGNPSYCCEDADEAVVNISSCGMAVDKRVTCDDPAGPGASFDPDVVDALPGATVGFAFDVCNTGNVPLTSVEINDALSCDGWFVPGSVSAFIGATDVTACVCPPGGCAAITDLNGTKDLTACLPEGIPTNGCATITLEVHVPDDYAAVGTPVDCVNMITVQSFSDYCASPDANPCPMDLDTASINVLVPGVECEKQICADINNDGDCADPGDALMPADIPFTSDLSMPCDVNAAFPIRLVYAFITTNGGEVDLVNAQACDADLVANAVAAGASFGACDLCVGACDGAGDTCADLGTILADGSATATCEIVFPTPESWFAFAGLDGGVAECHEDQIIVAADVDTTGVCARDAVVELMSTCGAQACLSPPCGLDVAKEFRCIESCADRTAVGADTNALRATPGAAIEFEITAMNVGDPSDPSICRLRFTDSLAGPFTPCAVDACTAQVINGSGNPICQLPGGTLPIDGTALELDLASACGVTLAPGDEIVIRCAGTVDAGAGSADVISNGLIVEGATACPPTGDITYCCDADTNAEVFVDTCAFTVVKQVGCAEPGSGLGDSVDVFPGGTTTFDYQVCNTGDVALVSLDILDALSCPTWYVPGSVACAIDGVDVTDCICPAGGCANSFDMNGIKDLTACHPDGIPTNGCMTCSFDVTAPPDFDVADEPVDCTNLLSVQAFTDVCASSADNPCEQHMDSATIDVRIPSYQCGKSVCLDANNDGDCLDAGDIPASGNMTIPADTAYPLNLLYTVSVENTSDVPMAGVEICDPVVGHAVAAGFSFGACSFCTDGTCDGVGDDCFTMAAVAGNSTSTATCAMTCATAAQLAFFMGLDGDSDPEAYVNTATFNADADSSGVCGEPTALAETVCQAALGQRIIPPVCAPLTKATYTIWNQNEVKLTGLHRCITMWDQAPFSIYGSQLHAPNHLLRVNLQTDKGKARIDGMASVLCVDDALESEPAPLIGVTQKLLYFNGVPTALTGMPLTGMGAESGYLRYNVGAPGGSERPEFNLERAANAGGDPQTAVPLPAGTPVAQVGVKGSLLVFPRVELRWTSRQGVWVPTQDTFIELTNDFPEDVLVQMYFVNGDKPLAAVDGERAHRGCNWVDVQLDLTGSQPTYWSAASGLPEGVSPFSVLDAGDPPGRPADDGSGDRVVRGYVVAWAVRYVSASGGLELHEIAWNHLTGAATIVNYGIGEAWSYGPWAFPTIGTVNGAEPDALAGNLNLDGDEYAAPPDLLLLDFYGDGATTFSRGGTLIQTESDVTLLPMLQDLRQR